jgi:hypothetical protein
VFVALLNLLIPRRRHLAALDQESVTPIVASENILLFELWKGPVSLCYKLIAIVMSDARGLY